MQQKGDDITQTNPVKAIHELCVVCMGGNPYLVKDCNSRVCPLQPWRQGNPYFNKPKPEGEITNPVKVIGNFCHSHCQQDEWDDECDETCPLYPFRNGRNPFRAERTEKQIEAAKRGGEVLRNYQKEKKPEGFPAQI